MEQRLRKIFSDMVVYKDLRNSNFFSALSLPSFMRDWLLRRFEDSDGNFDANELSDFVRRFIPKKDDWTAIKSRIVMDNEHVKLLAKISVEIDIANGAAAFNLPDFGLAAKETMIDENIWYLYKDELVGGREVWGMIELGYRPPDYDARPKIPGKIRLLKFKNFCPYKIDLDFYKDARKNFSFDEWLQILLGAIDYNAAGYERADEKLTMLTRLLPFVEKRLNLIELAPKGTGKSYVFGQVSRFGWLSSGGIMSRAKMFYDMQKRQEGLVAYNDFVALDEVQTISFKDTDELRAALKGFLENGIYTVGNHSNNADAGVILSGNISKATMDMDGAANMFDELPTVFHESALIERFHGFIKGWNIPRMNDDMKICGWALNSEYFCAILHELREDVSYRAIVDKLVKVPDKADTRDTAAIKRIATAYLKLFFPNVRRAEEVDKKLFRRHCLKRACQMRATIRQQLALLDVEYTGKNIPKFEVI
ncbi:MAG: BREX system Lon protease-like protein BrxL [Quinella sp. 1Q7]|nr:BREX system Lon protease-like protein BrxL [Quinella sp. 1Q7]